MLLTIGDGVDYRTKEAMSVSRNLATRFRNNLLSNETYKWMLDDLHIKETMDDYFPMKNATLKLWLLDKTNEDGSPLCIRSFKIFEKIDEETITSLAVDESNQLIALGCESGDIFLIQGDLSRAKKLSLTLLPKHFGNAITGVHFSFANVVRIQIICNMKETGCVPLYALSTSRIGCYQLPRETKKLIGFTVLEDGGGCVSHCSSVDSKGVLITANNDGLVYYSPSARGNSYLLAGEKSCLFSYRDCVVVSHLTDEMKWSVKVLNVENNCEEYELLVLR